ncbi:hypothetical protein ACOMHN_025692 [Nucella lapillus]
MIHELAHGVHLLGAKYAISGWQGRLQSLYRSAKYSSKWANTYAMSTQDEYFVKLSAYDQGLFQLVYDVYPCNNTNMKRCTYSRECRDQNNYCQSWATYGYCSSHAAYMERNCHRSCNLCGGGGGGANCRDDNQSCGYWARSGECSRNPANMHQYCKRSCNKC